MRFYETSYDNGTAPGTATTAGLANIGVVGDGTNKYGAAISFKAPKRVTNSSVSTWDSAGTANSLSRYLNGSFNAGVGSGTSVAATSINGFIFYANFTATNSLLIHYAADASLTGG